MSARSTLLCATLAVGGCLDAPPADDVTCTPGAQIACGCADGSLGAKRCAPDGSRFGGCLCGTEVGPSIDGGIAGDGAIAGDDGGAPGTGTICVQNDHPHGSWAVSGTESFGGMGAGCSTGHHAGGYSIAAGAATVSPTSAVLVGGGTLTFTVAFPQLRYFGYWRDMDLANYACQIQDHANYSMTAEVPGVVDAAASYGLPNLGVVAPTNGGPPPVQVAFLCDDCDSSAWGWCQGHACPNGIPDGWAAVKADVEARGAAVRAQHPNAHLMINLADGDGNGAFDFRIIPGFQLPSGVDWIGLECYQGAAMCQANLAALKPLLPVGARIVVLTPAANAYGDEATLVGHAQAMYDWSRTEPLVVAMMAFVWSKTQLCDPGVVPCTALAVHEMPTLLAKYRAIGDAITGRVGIAPKLDAQCPAN